MTADAALASAAVAAAGDAIVAPIAQEKPKRRVPALYRQLP